VHFAKKKTGPLRPVFFLFEISGHRGGPHRDAVHCLVGLANVATTAANVVALFGVLLLELDPRNLNKAGSLLRNFDCPAGIRFHLLHRQKQGLRAKRLGMFSFSLAKPQGKGLILKPHAT